VNKGPLRGRPFATQSRKAALASLCCYTMQ